MSRLLYYNKAILERVPEFSGSPEKEGITVAVSKSQQKAVHKYVKANYDRMELTIPKGQKDIIKSHAENRGESANGFVWRAVQETIERDSSGGPQEAAGAPVESQGISLHPDAIKTAQRAAQAAGEVVPVFVARAVETQAQRDELARRMEGGNP